MYIYRGYCSIVLFSCEFFVWFLYQSNAGFIEWVRKYSLFFSFWIKLKKYRVLSCSVVSDSLRYHGLQPARLLCSWDSPGKNTGMVCHSLLQGSSWPRDWTRVSSTAGRFCTSEPPGNPEIAEPGLSNRKALSYQPPLGTAGILNAAF